MGLVDELKRQPVVNLALGAGRTSIAGFQTVDIDPKNNPDFLMDIAHLDFEPGSINKIYASHVLEHLKPNGNRHDFYVQLLVKWRSFLKPGGKLILGVPNFEALALLFEKNQKHPEIQKTVADAIFGGARNEFDFHYSLFTEAILSDLLACAGFSSVESFEPFVEDETSHRLLGTPISLNLVASNGELDDVSSTSPQPLAHNVDTVSKVDELTELRIAADERLQLILELQNECDKREKTIASLLNRGPIYHLKQIVKYFIRKQ